MLLDETEASLVAAVVWRVAVLHTPPPRNGVRAVEISVPNTVIYCWFEHGKWIVWKPGMSAAEVLKKKEFMARYCLEHDCPAQARTHFEGKSSFNEWWRRRK